MRPTLLFYSVVHQTILLVKGRALALNGLIGVLLLCPSTDMYIKSHFSATPIVNYLRRERLEIVSTPNSKIVLSSELLCVTSERSH